jgi:hypothetical protein
MTVSDLHRCLTCGNPYLLGYEHRHSTPENTSYNPMADKPRHLEEFVIEARAEYRAETPSRIHGREQDDPLAAGSSPDWTHAFRRRMGHPDDDYGTLYPSARTLYGLRRWCEGKHRDWADHRGRPVCWSLVTHIIVGRQSVQWAAEQEELSLERAMEHAERALRKQWRWRSDLLNEIELRPRRDAA